MSTSSKKQTIGYKYYLGMHLVLCHGPIDNINKIEVDGETAWEGTATGGSITIDAEDLFGGESSEGGVSGVVDVMMGESTQGQNSYMKNILGSLLPTYRGLCSLVLNNVYLGVNPYLKNWAVYATRILTRQDGLPQWYSEKAQIGLDMNPAHIIYECLTDSGWGMGYTDLDLDIDSFVAAADTLYDEGMGISLLWSQSMTIEEFINLIVGHIQASLYVSRASGLFTLKLARADYEVGNLIELGDAEIDHIDNYKRSTISELTNSVTVTYWDREIGDDNSVTVEDIALVGKQGGVISITKSYAGFTTAENAAKAASRDLKELSTPLATCIIYADRSASSLNPGSVFKMTWSQYGITQSIMRVVSVELGTLSSNLIKLTVIEDVFGSGSAIFGTPPSTGWVNPNNLPSPCPYHTVIEAPYWELVQRKGESEAEQVDETVGYMLVTGVRPTSDAKNAKFFVDSRGEYEEAGTLDFTPSCATIFEYGPNETHIQVTDWEDMNSTVIGDYAVWEDEIVEIEEVTETYITVGRGCLDTTPAISHPAGSRLFMADTFYESDNIEYSIGDSINVKVLPTTGKGTLAIDSAQGQEVAFVGRQKLPYPPQRLRIAGSIYPEEKIGSLAIVWAHRDRLQQTAGLINTSVNSIGPESGTTYTATVTRDDTGAVLWQTESITSESTSSFTVPYSGPIKASVVSFRDGLQSFQPLEWVFNYIPEDMLIDVAGLPTTEPDFYELDEVISITPSTNVGQSPFTWAYIGTLPAELGFNSSTGVISGTATTEATYTVTLSSTDAQGFSATKEVTFTIDGTAYVFGTPEDGSPLTEYTFTPTTANVDTPQTWSVISGSLPTGLSLDSATGELSGTLSATTNGTHVFTLEVSDGVNSASKELTLVVSGSIGNYYAHLYDGTNFVSTVQVSTPEGAQETWTSHSTDSVNWTLEQNPTGFSVSDMAYGLGIYVANGGATGNYFGVADSLSDTWDVEHKTSFPVSGAAGGIRLGGLIFDGTKFIIGGEYGMILTRTDVVGWAEIPTHDLQTSSIDFAIRDFCYDGTYYWCYAYDGEVSGGDRARVYRSSDLITWTMQVDLDVNSYGISKIAIRNGNLFVIGSKQVSGNTKPFLYVSADQGATWGDYSPSTTQSYGAGLDDVVYFDSKYVLIGSSYLGYGSSLGTWTVNETSEPIRFSKAATDGTTLICTKAPVSSTTGESIKTTDGITWTAFER